MKSRKKFPSPSVEIIWDSAIADNANSIPIVSPKRLRIPGNDNYDIKLFQSQNGEPSSPKQSLNSSWLNADLLMYSRGKENPPIL